MTKGRSAEGRPFDSSLAVRVTGIATYLAVVAIERLVIPWHASMRGGGT